MEWPKNSQSSWRSWVSRNFVNPAGFLSFLVFLSGNASAWASDYRRAQQLKKTDPLEAEALLERFVANAESPKMRRAANYELFYLRLSNGRLSEALAQAKNKDLLRRFNLALSEAYSLSTDQAGGLSRRLRQACAKERSAAELGEYLRRQKLGAKLWDFALRVLQRCGISGRSKMFADNLFEKEEPDRFDVTLQLLAIREQAYADADTAAELLAVTRSVAENNFPGDAVLMAQLVLLDARIAALQNNFGEVIKRCGRMDRETAPPQAQAGCHILVAHAEYKSGRLPAAWKAVQRVPVNSLDMDNRLLRLIIAVAAGVSEADKLQNFTRRASYHYCAQSLRSDAHELLSGFNPK